MMQSESDIYVNQTMNIECEADNKCNEHPGFFFTTKLCWTGQSDQMSIEEASQTKFQIFEVYRTLRTTLPFRPLPISFLQ